MSIYRQMDEEETVCLFYGWVTVHYGLRNNGLFSSVRFSLSVVSNSLQPHVLQHTRPPCPSPTPWVHSDSMCPALLPPARLLCSWDFASKNTGVGCHFLLQGIFLTQESNLRLLHWQTDSLPLSHLGSPIVVCVFIWQWSLHRQKLGYIYSHWFSN